MFDKSVHFLKEMTHVVYQDLLAARGATKGGLKGAQAPPQPKIGVPCNSARSDDFLLGGVLALALLWTLPLFHYSLLKLRRIRLPACLYFKIHRQLTIVEVLSEGTLLMSVADIAYM